MQKAILTAKQQPCTAHGQTHILAAFAVLDQGPCTHAQVGRTTRASLAVSL